MPTEIIKYQCNICKIIYSSLQEAFSCESRGIHEEYPIGCIYGNHTPGDMYENITLAVAENKIQDHANWGSSWACRDNGYGDSVGDKMCGSPTLTLTKHFSKLDPLKPHFKRMVKWLRDNQIEITVWDGEKPILYATFMKLFRQEKN